MTFRKGEWRAVCDRCGREFKASKLKLDWQGLRVCADDFEERHPQEFVRAVRPDKAPYGAKAIGEYLFVNPGDVTEADL